MTPLTTTRLGVENLACPTTHKIFGEPVKKSRYWTDVRKSSLNQIKVLGYGDTFELGKLSKISGFLPELTHLCNSCLQYSGTWREFAISCAEETLVFNPSPDSVEALKMVKSGEVLSARSLAWSVPGAKIWNDMYVSKRLDDSLTTSQASEWTVAMACGPDYNLVSRTSLATLVSFWWNDKMTSGGEFVEVNSRLLGRFEKVCWGE